MYKNVTRDKKYWKGRKSPRKRGCYGSILCSYGLNIGIRCFQETAKRLIVNRVH